jgi:hypothetical protein
MPNNPMDAPKQSHMFWIIGIVLFAAGIPAVAIGYYNDSLTFTMVGLSELVCGLVLITVGLLRHQRLKRERP